jgi:hypothetical protein
VEKPSKHSKIKVDFKEELVNKNAFFEQGWGKDLLCKLYLILPVFFRFF